MAKKREHFQCVYYVTQELLQQLLDYQAKIESLYSRAGEILPVELRKEPQIQPIPIKALADYAQSEVLIYIHKHLT